MLDHTWHLFSERQAGSAQFAAKLGIHRSHHLGADLASPLHGHEHANAIAQQVDASQHAATALMNRVQRFVAKFRLADAFAASYPVEHELACFRRLQRSQVAACTDGWCSTAAGQLGHRVRQLLSDQDHLQPRLAPGRGRGQLPQLPQRVGVQGMRLIDHQHGFAAG
ncbi:MAG: hypothetical protein ACRC2B_15070, partial [Rubrivivax sp.]